ncbi:T9SS type A sorting domain-containing protein [Reichenbachiella carrageenanivorans]|uniref:T9SS type A sorting domain-containing protein n=1 Tax=Reichenbachiella carrageenanivorans TaxID=2979869 RepID=A0ABY6D132_9BACT|nr:T9SS type A sorting domain-containing protein [Reichenbachiella carrageenanivorans]UXX79872.1 T9SS type A sorting domain-containing protein [Reichenbachiella carrageenanivorans]
MAAQETIDANIYDLVYAEVAALPGASTNVFTSLDGEDKSEWQTLVDKVISKEYAEAALAATGLGYELVNVKDTDGGKSLNLYMLRKLADSDNYWGTYIFNDKPARAQVVIQSPHAIKDRNTGVEGAYVFREMGARAFFLTGTDRCNSLASSSCSGTTSVCGYEEKYRISDVAHNTNGAFQIVTELLNDAESNYFIQLHGFDKTSSDPSAILSLGGRTIVGSNKMPDIETNLKVEDNLLTFENSTNNSWSKLLGFTNTQGRYINQGTDPCMSNAETANGRFIHIEQEYDRLRKDVDEWKKMANALKATFPLSDGSITSVGIGEPKDINLYPNPIVNSLSIRNSMNSRLNLKIFTLSGEEVLNRSIEVGINNQSASALERGVYLYTVSDGQQVVRSGKLVKQ